MLREHFIFRCSVITSALTRAIAGMKCFCTESSLTFTFISPYNKSIFIYLNICIFYIYLTIYSSSVTKSRSLQFLLYFSKNDQLDLLNASNSISQNMIIDQLDMLKASDSISQNMIKWIC